MPVASSYHTRSQVHRNPRGFGSTRDSQDLTFLDQPWYYETDDSLSQISVSMSRSGKDESEPVHPMSQMDNASQDSQQALLQLVKPYSLHIIITAILYMFLFEVTVRPPFLLALAFAIPSTHMLLVPEKPKSEELTYNNDSEALYRRSSIVSVVPGVPVAQYQTAGILHPVAISFPGLKFFSPLTWFSRATDPIGIPYRRQRLHTTFHESAYQPRRTFREAFADTVPRLLESWTMFVLRAMFYHVISRVIMYVIGCIYKDMIGEEMNVDAYIIKVLRFYWDWAAGMSGIASYGVKWAVSKLVMLFSQLLVWLGRQTTMFTGVMRETWLEYEDFNTVQF